MSILLYRNLLTIGAAMQWARRCTGEAADLLDALVPEIEAAAYETGLLYIRALKGMERHHADALTCARWILVAEAIRMLIQGDINRLTGGLIRP